MTLSAMPTAAFAITMQPLDWAISIGALMMLLFAARSLVSGKGRSQMGLSFAFVASVVWTFAIGRHIDGFTTLDGIRVAVGALLLVPVLRALFSQTNSSITGAVVALVAASVVAGPVVARYSPNVLQSELPADERLSSEIEEVDGKIAELAGTVESIAGFAAIERTRLTDLGVKTEADIDANPEAMTALKRWAGYKGELKSLSLRMKDLREKKSELEAFLSALERSGGNESSITAADAIREAVEREAGREDKTLIEDYSDRAKMLELFAEEFGDTSSEALPD